MATYDASPRNVNPVADAVQDQVGVDYYDNDIEDFWKALVKKSDEFWKVINVAKNNYLEYNNNCIINIIYNYNNKII